MTLDEGTRRIGWWIIEVADWLEARRLAKLPPAPVPEPMEWIVLHGGPKHGKVLPVLAGVDRVEIPAPLSMAASFMGPLDEGPTPEPPKFTRYVYKRQTYGQVIDGDYRQIYYYDEVIHG